MNMLSSVGVNPSGFSKLLCTKFYAHIVRLQLEYGLAINRFTFLFRSLYLPEDALLACLLPYIRNTGGSQWYALSRTPLWKTRFLQQNLEIRQRYRNSKLLSSCRRSISLASILWLPMSKSERSRCIRWRLGWLPGGKPRSCLKHPTQQLSKDHAISCLDMHRRLFMPETIRDPLSFLLNMLPLRPSPIKCSLLHELDQLHYNKLISTKHPHGQKLLVWLKQFI
ncbi:hypothetical protein BCV72DRAFT_328256 [Rhizopus microsporus var. microsporus]|uniref:Uncharacterized protein n=1 Tax=Rhizopus microsporus var. microsporus TaxID=86635 RepID=A0A1X0R3K7_RHIZD|nr:hypothetical protein BCV72DRAFT_328256 [Rhizopus microsporus var. microsporus]